MKEMVLAFFAAGLLVAGGGAGLAAQDNDRLSASQRKFETLAFVARHICAPAAGSKFIGVLSVGAGSFSTTTGEFCMPR
jgi:hypothetical protein